VPIASVSVAKPTLDEVFFAITGHGAETETETGAATGAGAGRETVLEVQ
jgi:ABC-2 type transport system ATP-binding protein